MTTFFFSAHCLRTIKSSCARCVSVCPHGAISPTNTGVAVDQKKCAGCGICAAACPVSVFAPHPDNRHLARRLAEIRTRPTLTLACPASGHVQSPRLGPQDPGNAFAVTGCPAALLPATLAACAASGVADLNLLHGNCEACSRGDKKGLNQVVALWNALFNGLAAALHVPPDGGGSPINSVLTPVVTRRDFFRLPLASVAGKRRFDGLCRLDADLWRDANHPFFLRMFQDIVKEHPATVRQDAMLPVPLQPFSVTIDPQTCNACGACVRGCPGKALELRVRDSATAVRFTPGRCVRCGKCKDVCVAQSVYLLSGPMFFHDWLHGATTCIPRAEKQTACARCRAPFAPRDTEDVYCGFCKKRFGFM